MTKCVLRGIFLHFLIIFTSITRWLTLMKANKYYTHRNDLVYGGRVSAINLHGYNGTAQ